MHPAMAAWARVFRAATILSAAALLFSLSAYAVEPLPQIGADQEVKVLPLVAGSNPPSAAPSLRLRDESEAGLTLEFELPALLQSEIAGDGRSYDLLAIENGGFDGAAGEPMIPTFTRLLQIPDRAGVRVEILATETTEFSGVQLMPMQFDDAPFAVSGEAYQRSGYSDQEPAVIGEPGVMRDLRVVPIRFHPLRYDPAAGKVEVARKIEVRVTFAGEDLRNAKIDHAQRIASSFDQLYSNLVVNYRGPRDGQQVGLGSYVIICPNNSTVLDMLADLVDWRRKKGFDVYVATTAETGTTTSSIQTWLRSAYATWSNPPEYIALVGDADGSSAVMIPCFSYSDGDTDFPYAQLDGSDVLPDAHVGRISVRTTTQLENYVQKMVNYESSPYLTDTAWYTRGCVAGDPSSSGYTCVQIGQWLKRRLLANGYTQVDTVFTGDFPTAMTTALNRGDTAFMYRGYWGMSNFDMGDIYAVNNGRKHPFTTQITCDTGSFEVDETARTEAWIRSGSVASPRGAVGAVGASTINTHTRYNNCITYGIWGGIFNEQIYTFGAALTRGKWELYLNYSAGDINAVWNFSHWVNLMGDPAGEIWTGVPQAIAVGHPSTLARNANAVTVSVTQGGLPCAGATVCLYREGLVHEVGLTGPTGAVDLPVDATTDGVIEVAVTKHNCQPYKNQITIGQEARFIGYNTHTIDDNASGSSVGNGDGIVNPGEQIEMPVQAKNFGTQAVQTISATLSSDDPYVSITDAAETFANLAPGATAWTPDDFDVTIDGGAPNGHVALCELNITSGSDAWRSLIELPVVAAAFSYSGVTLYGVSTTLDPGETGEISVRILNDGDAAASSVTAQLVSHDSWLTITDASAAYGNIAIGGNGDNTADRFGVSAASECYRGHLAALSLYLQFSSGARDTVHFTLTVGTKSTTDPTGPDAYGYYAFDNTDTSYPDAPAYSWIEIDPRYSGQGVSAGLVDNSDEALGDSETFTLPFSFSYYGQEFTRVTICSNGWIAMGSTPLANYNNWTIPCLGAAPNLIAPKWDGMYQSGDNKVYYWSDTAGHRFVVQWSRMINDATGGTENFEVILYDPAYFPTATEDGIIVFQYQAYSAGNASHNYWTTGIQNADQTDGVLYAYFNAYNGGAAALQNGRAIKFLPIQVAPGGTLAGMVINSTDGGTPLEGASITIPERGTLTSQEDGSYSGPVQVGTYNVIVSHPSFAPDTAFAVQILEDQETTVNFALADIYGPAFATTQLPTTGDTAGPYEILSTVTDFSTIEELELVYNPGGHGWMTVPLVAQGNDVYRAEIPGQPFFTLVQYYLQGRDSGDLTTTDPFGAPGESFSFWVIPPLFEDEMEEGSGGWMHAIVTSGYVDQWHLSTERNHTTAGASSWKCGDTGTGAYAHMSDGALTTETVVLDGEPAALTFWQWMEAEVSSGYPTQAYDGGVIEMSVDGGVWSQVTPVGGYTHTVRVGTGPGPLPMDTPLFSGTYGWTQTEVDLTGVSGDVRIRFRFTSDGSVALEGWHIDDVQLIGTTPSPAGLRELELLPTRLALHQNLPNPFGAAARQTTIGFDLPRPANVRLAILDVSGRMIEMLVDEPLPAGRHLAVWHGQDARGHRVESGVYFYVLRAGNEELTQRMLLLR